MRAEPPVRERARARDARRRRAVRSSTRALREVRVDERLEPGSVRSPASSPDSLGDQRAECLARLTVGRHDADHTVSIG